MIKWLKMFLKKKEQEEPPQKTPNPTEEFNKFKVMYEKKQEELKLQSETVIIEEPKDVVDVTNLKIYGLTRSEAIKKNICCCCKTKPSMQNPNDLVEFRVTGVCGRCIDVLFVASGDPGSG